jgi:hypothetical protein
MDMRNYERIPLYGLPAERSGNFADFELDGISLRAAVTDISLKGVGLEFPSMNDDTRALLENSSTLFVRINIDDAVVFAGLNRSWFVSDAESKSSFRGGFSFNILSPDDALLLHRIIGIIRERNA